MFMGAGMGFGMGQGMYNQMQNNMNMNNGGGAMPPPVPGVVKFFIANNGQQQGPYEMPMLGQMIKGGQVNQQTLVWREGMAAWSPAGQVPELATLFGAVPPPVPPQ